jgi:hypothetical protein
MRNLLNEFAQGASAFSGHPAALSRTKVLPDRENKSGTAVLGICPPAVVTLEDWNRERLIFNQRTTPSNGELAVA